MNYRDPQLCDQLAAEYVLGTLRGPARRRFEGLLQARPDLRRLVRTWEERLPQVLGQPPAEQPPPELWHDIEGRLFAERHPVPPPAPSPWYRWLWRPLALGSGLTALVLATVLLLPPGWISGGRMPDYVATINDAQQAVWLISAGEDMDRLHVKNVMPMDMPPNDRCVLWYQPMGEPQPFPLGVLPDQGDEMTLTLADNARPRGPGQLLVTIEHMDGDMPERPSSAPLYWGKWMPLEPI